MTIQFSSYDLASAVMASWQSGEAPGVGVDPTLRGLEARAQAAGPGMKYKKPLRLGGASAYSDVGIRLREATPQIALGRLPLAIERGHGRARKCPLMLGDSIEGGHVVHTIGLAGGMQAPHEAYSRRSTIVAWGGLPW